MENNNIDKKRKIETFHRPYTPKYSDGGFSHLTEDQINSIGSEKKNLWRPSNYRFETLAESSAKEQEKGRELKLVNKPNSYLTNQDKK